MNRDVTTYTGPAIDDPEILAKLPTALVTLLEEANGFIQFKGGFHLRGACLAPAWHSLRDAWIGPNAFHELYEDVEPDDIPFAEDCLGDQFLLRKGEVWRLFCETGEMESLELNFKKFMKEAADDPVEVLGFEPLLKFQRDGGKLEPGQLLAAWPPFCTEEAEDGVELKALPAGERRRFLADFAAKIRDVDDGEQIDVELDN